MTQRDDGGSAFPSTPLGDNGKPGGAHRFGMSLREYFAGQALAGLCANPHYSPSLATSAHAVEEADKLLMRLSDSSPVVWAARSLAPEGGEMDPKERLPRDADIILEALNEYDAFMLDDDYDAQACFTRVMKRMRERYQMVDRSPQPDQSELLREAEGVIRYMWDLLPHGDPIDKSAGEVLAKLREAMGDE